MFVVVGVTGGIAAYKTVSLVRLLVKAGHEVHVVPTGDALRFVGLPTWEALSRNPVTTSVHDDVASVRHVSLGRSADLVIVAPATANTLAAMAAGLASDLLGTTLLATTAPVVVAPAMHTEMWRHPATTHNIEVLRARGVHVVGPADGALTGGDSGPGRMSEPEEIAAAALALVERPRDLQGLSIVVSAGGTREPIDPVRYLGNRSSGRQGVALARAAADRGAHVTLVAAHLDADVRPDPRIEVVAAGTADELGEAMDAMSPGADVVIMAAAVADYSVAQAVATVRQLEQQYQQLQATYNVLAHTTNVSAYANRLGYVANGYGATEIGGALTGVGSLAGAADQVASLRHFQSSGTDFSATELTRRAQRLGNVQAAALQGMRQSEQRIAGLRELMGEIDGQPDIQASAALNNRIQAEHALLSAQQQQLAQLQMMASVQQQGDVLRAEEAQRQSAEQWRDSLPPLGND